MSRSDRAGAVVSPGVGLRWRRFRWPLAVLLVVLVASVVIGLTGSGSVHGELDPAATDPAGSRALATLLTDRGVPVHRVNGIPEALDRGGELTTLVIPFPNRIPAVQLGRVVDAYPGSRVVLVGPDSDALAALDSRIVPHGTARVTRRDPRCGLPAAPPEMSTWAARCTTRLAAPAVTPPPAAAHWWSPTGPTVGNWYCSAPVT